MNDSDFKVVDDRPTNAETPDSKDTSNSRMNFMVACLRLYLCVCAGDTERLIVGGLESALGVDVLSCVCVDLTANAVQLVTASSKCRTLRGDRPKIFWGCCSGRAVVSQCLAGVICRCRLIVGRIGADRG